MELIFDGPPLLGQSVPKVGQEMERGVYMGIFDKLKDSKNDKTFEDKLSYIKKCYIMRVEIAIPHTSPVNYNLNWTTFQAALSSFIKNFITASFTMQAEEWDC